jgi:hypothetical protein
MIPSLEGGLFVKNHTFGLSISDIEVFQSRTFSGTSEEEGRLYIKCQDPNSNIDVAAKAVSFCVAPGEDKTAPKVTVYDPPGGLLPFEATSDQFKVSTNEPAECRYSTTDKTFNEMENNIQCDGSRICNGDVTISSPETKIFVRCKDHPEWEGTDKAGNRNSNNVGVSVVFKRSASALSIKSISPNGNVYTTGNPKITVNLDVRTEGGADGTANCFWQLNDYAKDLMDETGGVSHNQDMEVVIGTEEGEKTHFVFVECGDDAGNYVNRTSNFTTNADFTWPKVTRYMESGGSLSLFTDESAECVYRSAPLEGMTDPCNYEIKDGTKISSVAGSNGKEHRTSFEPGTTYFIKCKDGLGNYPASECSERVSLGF